MCLKTLDKQFGLIDWKQKILRGLKKSRQLIIDVQHNKSWNHILRGKIWALFTSYYYYLDVEIEIGEEDRVDDADNLSNNCSSDEGQISSQIQFFKLEEVSLS